MFHKFDDTVLAKHVKFVLVFFHTENFYLVYEFFHLVYGTARLAFSFYGGQPGLLDWAIERDKFSLAENYLSVP